MSEKLDNDLVNRIKEVFDNYKDTSADEGWLLLRERFPEKEKERRGLVWLWWSAAAVLLIGLGISFWLIKAPAVNQHIAQNKHQIQPTTKAIDSADTTAKSATEINNSTNKTTAKLAASSGAPLKDQGNKHARSASASAVSAQQQVTASGVQIEQVRRLKKHNSNKYAGLKQPHLPSGNPPASNTTLASTGESAGAKMQGPVSKNSGSAADNQQDNNVKTPDNQNQVKEAPASAPVLAKTPESNPDHAESSKQMEQLLARDRAVKTMKTAQKDEESRSNDKKVVFGLYAATYFSSAKGSNNQLNGGGGFSSDIRLNSRIKLSTGIAIGQNTLSYGNSPSTVTAASPIAAATATRYYTFNTVGATYASSTPSVLKKYNANLVGLDIPFNFKFQLTSKKADPFVAAGFSSGTFINETYTYSYTYANSLYNLTGALPQDQVIHKNFGSFNFIKTLNLSFGMGTDLGKSNRLVIEPFVRYPFVGAGDQNIKFTSSGVNLKFVFEGKKK